MGHCSIGGGKRGRCGGNRPPRPPSGRARPAGPKCREDCGRRRGALPSAAEPCTGSSPCRGSRGFPLPRPRRLRAETALRARCVRVTARCPPFPVSGCSRVVTPSRAGRPRAGWVHAEGARPRAGEGDPSSPSHRSSRSPGSPARRTRPELPLPVRVPGARPTTGDARPRTRGTARWALRPLPVTPASRGTRVKDFLPASGTLTSPG